MQYSYVLKRTPLALACKSSKLEPVKYLLNDPRIDITLVDSIGVIYFKKYIL